MCFFGPREGVVKPKGNKHHAGAEVSPLTLLSSSKEGEGKKKTGNRRTALHLAAESGHIGGCPADSSLKDAVVASMILMPHGSSS
eukprot:gene2154-18204_t